MSEGTASSPVTIEELLEHGRWVRRLATSLVVGEEAAEELAQASLVQAISHPPHHRGNLRSWLATITRNIARERGKAKSRERDPRFLEAAQRENALESGDQIVARIETQRLVSEVLLGLDPKLRDVLVLRFYDELSYREIGEQLGMPTETARSRVTRGLAELRQELDQRGGEHAVEWRAGLVLWLGAGALTRLTQSSAATAGATAGRFSWISLSAPAQLVLGLLFAGLVAVFWWSPWSASETNRATPVVLDPDPEARAIATNGNAADDVAAHSGDREPATASRSASARGERVANTGFVARRLDRSPVVGARVRITSGGPNGTLRAIETTTDVDGRFRFDGVLQDFTPGPENLLAEDADSFVLRIEAPGLASFEDRLARSVFSGDDRGASALDADLGGFELSPALRVRAELVGDWGPSGGLWVADLKPCELTATRLRQIGSWGEGRRPTWWDTLGAYTHHSARRVLLAYDGEGLASLELDLPLESDESHVFTFERAPPGRVEVQLQDGEGRPVPDVSVVATPLYWPLRGFQSIDYCLHSDFSRPTGFDATRRSTTDERGIAVFDALPSAGVAAAYAAAASNGLHPQGTYVFCAGKRGSERMPHRSAAPYLVLAGDVNRVTLNYDASAQVDLEGVVRDSSGKPLAGVRVTAIDRLVTNSMLGHQGPPTEIETRTAADGRFLLRGVDRHAQGVETLSIDGREIGLALIFFDLPVPTGKPLEIELPAAFPLRGWLLDANGHAVQRPGLEVVLRPHGLDPHHRLPFPDLNLRVAVDGSFEVKALPAGEWLIYALDFEQHGLVPFEPLVHRAGDESPLITVHGFDTLSTRVVLNVRDAREETQYSVAEAVAVREEDQRRTPLVIDATGGIGSAEVTWEALPPGTWRIHLRLHGGRRLWWPLKLDGSQALLAERVDLTSPGSLRVNLEFGAGITLLANDVVTARLIGPEWVDAGPDVESRFGAVGVQARRDGEGRFHFDELSPGRYELRLVASGRVAHALVDVTSGESLDVTLPVTASRRLILTGDAQSYLEQGHRLCLYLRDAEDRFVSWPIRFEGGVAIADLPAGTREWEARWWSTGLPGRQRAMPLAGRASGTLDAADPDPIHAPLPL